MTTNHVTRGVRALLICAVAFNGQINDTPYCMYPQRSTIDNRRASSASTWTMVSELLPDTSLKERYGHLSDCSGLKLEGNRRI